MTKEIVWVHEKALNNSLLGNPKNNKLALFIWDNSYFKNRAYTFKRLVFIYETLCQMPVEILKGNTIDVIKSFSPSNIKTQFTVDTKIREIIQHLSKDHNIEVIKPVSFVEIPDDLEFKRFFKYWNKAKKTAFLQSSNSNALKIK